MTVLRPDAFDILNDHRKRLDDIEAGCPPFFEPDSSTFQNGWDWAGTPFERWGYRICDGALEFKGHLFGGASGTVCYTLPANYRIFIGDLSDLTDLGDGAGSIGSTARIYIDMTSGDITLTFPV